MPESYTVSTNLVFKVLIGVMAVVFLILTWNGFHTPEWKKRAETALHTSDSIQKINETAVHVADSLHVVGNQKTVEIQRLSHFADSLRKVTRKRQIVADSILKNTPKECEADVISVMEVANGYRLEADRLQRALTLANGRDSTRLVEIDTLRRSLMRATKSNADLSEQLKVALRQDKILFGLVPMPSRKASFLIGAATGIAAAAYISRH
jgi:hypothetical protein